MRDQEMDDTVSTAVCLALIVAGIIAWGWSGLFYAMTVLLVVRALNRAL